jgi:CubicO group peptidase (beta-lactamase class C family)
MARERKRIVSLVLASLLGVVLGGCGSHELGPARSSEVAAQVAALFEPWMEEDSPGAAVLVIEDGEILFEGGFGLAQIESRTPITPQSAFRLASVSKQFTAMAIMILAGDGAASLSSMPGGLSWRLASSTLTATLTMTLSSCRELWPPSARESRL